MNAMTATMLDDPRATPASRDRGFDLGGSMVSDPGHTPVPTKPSAMMLAAGSRAGGVTVETAWRIYQAMVNEAA